MRTHCEGAHDTHATLSVNTQFQKPPIKRPKSSPTEFAAGLLFPIVAGTLVYSLMTPPSIPPGDSSVVAAASFTDPTPLKLPAPMTQPIGDIIEFVVGRNDTLERIFRQARLNLEDLAT